MNPLPTHHHKIITQAKIGRFSQAAHLATVSFLRSLVASRSGLSALELGTGLGLATAWMLSGMDGSSHLTSVDNEKTQINFVQETLGDDPRLTLICQDGAEFIQSQPKKSFDFIFADTWPGKYFCLTETLALLRPRGIYLIDDMAPVDTWPKGHADKAKALLDQLAGLPDFWVSQLDFATGLVLCVKQGEAV